MPVFKIKTTSSFNILLRQKISKSTRSENIIILSNINHTIAVISNEDNIENLTLNLKRKGFPMDQVYRIVPRKNQYFCSILDDLDIPQNRIDFYTNCLQYSKHLLVVKTTKSQLSQVQSVFNNLGITDWEIYYTPDAYHLNSSNLDEISVSPQLVYSMILSYS